MTAASGDPAGASGSPSGSETKLSSVLVTPDGRAELQGGAFLTVSSLRFHGRELLADPASLRRAYRVHDARAGITLLHPWANRLGSDVIHHGARTARLEPGDPRLSRDDHGLAIHGVSARPPWQLRRDGPAHATSSLSWPEDPAFPFPHTMEVSFALSQHGRRLGLEIVTRQTAKDRSPVPVSFGWHPYLLAGPGTEVDLPSRRTAISDARGLPTGAWITEPPRRESAGATPWDHGLGDIPDGCEFRLHHPSYTATVRWGPGYRYGQLFTPGDAPIACFEPMTAPTNALIDGEGLPAASTSQPFLASFTLEIVLLG